MHAPCISKSLCFPFATFKQHEIKKNDKNSPSTTSKDHQSPAQQEKCCRNINRPHYHWTDSWGSLVRDGWISVTIFKYIWICRPLYRIISILYHIHILSYSYSMGGSATVLYSYVVEYIQKLIFRIIFLASTSSNTGHDKKWCLMTWRPELMIQTQILVVQRRKTIFSDYHC
jgi:hypothetical protein